MICCGKEVQDKYGCPNCNGDSLHAYQCTNCKKFWSESELDTKEVSDTSEFWGAMDTTISICLACPSCGFDELEEATPCCACFDRLAEEDDELCASCREQEDEQEAMIKINENSLK
jgi:hypothetical protein